MKRKLATTAPAARRLGQGFTLIEIMITVAIVAIISAIALPSYTSYVARGKRADARGQLLQSAQFMQRFYAANDKYNLDRSGQQVSDVMPGNLKKSPGDSDAPQYTLSINASSDGMSYTLTMAPVSGRS